MTVATPPIIPEPFANDGDRASIPDTTIVAGRASYSLGFPPITMQSKISGGIPPDGRDVNGALFDVTSHAYFLQAGKLFTYSSSVSTIIGGYDIGALLQSTDGETLWLNQTAANTGNPDSGFVGWVPVLTYGLKAISGLTGGTVILTSDQARYNLLVLSGTLASNLAIILPADIRAWRIVNNCTGAFATTVRTASGTGVTVPQGGFAQSTPVYGDGTNIYFDVPPVSIPSDVAATPNTLIMRNNTADAFARYYNTAAPAESFSVAYFMGLNGADGYLRPVSFGDVQSQLLSNAALTGVPTAPTAAVNTNTTQVATTAFVQSMLPGGPGQVYHSGGRALGTLYSNTSGHPIFVIITLGIAASGSANIFVGGVQIARVFRDDNFATAYFPVSFIVPAGATYQVVNSGAALISWNELY